MVFWYNGSMDLKIVFSKKVLIGASLAAVAFWGWYYLKTPPKEGDWQEPFKLQSTAEFKGDTVLVKNVRDFRYAGPDQVSQVFYYDREYDLAKLSRVWYIMEPFSTTKYAAHTFVSFEFSDGKFLSISIEARKQEGQQYGLVKGLFKTYPLMYIAADERDTILMRANVRKGELYLYPVKTTPEKARMLFVDMMEKMNGLAQNPEWYNTFTANCTSMIAWHINKISPGRLPWFNWQAIITGYADSLAFERGFIDTDLDFTAARKKYYITDVSQRVGDVPDYSQKIREFK